MTTGRAVVQQFQNTPDLPERDRGAAEAVAAGLRDAKAENTRRAYSSAWQQFRRWAGPSPPSSRPARPSPTFTAPPGCRRATIRPSTRWCPTRQGVAQPGPGSQAGRRPHRRRPRPGPRGTPPAQDRPRRANGVSRHRPAACRPGPGHHRGPGRRRAKTLRSRRPDLGRRGAVCRRHRPSHYPKGQEPGRTGHCGGHRPRPAGYPA